MSRFIRSLASRRSERGQALVELAMVLPVLLIITLGTLEFGFVFDHHLTIEYASREGARTGAALANGGGTMGCGSGQSPNAASVDPQIIAAVQRVLTSPGSDVDLTDVIEVRIYKSDANGGELGPVNTWAPGSGPVVDGGALEFAATSTGWAACSRDNGGTPDSIGVSVTYEYQYRTALTALMGMTTLTMHDRTVMQLNPTN